MIEEGALNIEKNLISITALKIHVSLVENQSDILSAVYLLIMYVSGIKCETHISVCRDRN